MTFEFDPSSARPLDDPGAFDPSTAAPLPKAGVIRRIADMTAVPLAQGVVGVPEAAVGLADLVTGGRAGKAAEEAGFRPREAKQIIGDALYSDEQKAADRTVAEADGFLPTLAAAVQNPSTIARTVAESVPSMFAGGAISRIARGVAPALNPLTAGAAGEGAVMAGSAAENIRQETPDKLLSPLQAGAAALTGIAGGAITRIAGQAAAKAGIGDVENLMAGGATAATTKGVTRRVAEGFFREGALEELPQSVQEQILQNVALGKPWDEGVGSAAAMGLLAGGVMGAAAGPMGNAGPAPAPPPPQVLRLTNDPDPLIGFPDGTVGRREVEAYIASLPEEKRVTEMARLLGRTQPADETQLGAAPFRAAPAAPLRPPVQPSVLAGQALDFETSPGAAPPPVDPVTYEPVLGDNPNIQGVVDATAHRGPVNVNLDPPGAPPAAPGAPPLDPAAGPISRAAIVALQNGAVPPAGAAAPQNGPSATETPPAVPPAAPFVPQPGDIVVDEHFQGAHQAATSPTNPRPEPTDGQKRAENYKVGTTRVGRMVFRVENPQGSIRSGKDENGNDWSIEMVDHYTRMPGTKAADSTPQKKSQLDAFIKVGTPRDYAGPIFVIDQVNPKTGKFDEHKLIVGATDEADAAQVYQRNYEPGWNGMGSVTQVEQPAFKKWAYDGTVKTQPLGDLSLWKAPQAAEPAPAPAAPPPPAPVATPAPAAATPAPAPAARPTKAPAPKGLRLGVTPGDAEPVTVQGGVVHVGKYPAVHFETNEPVTVPEGASDADIGRALKAAGVLSTRQRLFGGKVDKPAEVTKPPSAPAPSPQPAPAPSTAPAPESDESEDGLGTRGGIDPKQDPDAPQWTGFYDVVEKSNDTTGWRRLGVNLDGNPVFEAGGMRLVLVGDYRVAELAHKPRSQRVAEFRTQEEIAKERAPAPTPKPDKAEIRPYRKPDGTVGYEAVPIEPPAPSAAPAPAAADDELAQREKAAKAKMLSAAGKLAHLLSKNTRLNITPEQEQAMLPIVIELFEGAMELGYVKFKQAARYVRKFIAEAIDQDAADSIPIDTLQGAYIATARRHADKEITPKAEVITVNSIEELGDDAAPSDTAGVEKQPGSADTSGKDTDDAERNRQPRVGGENPSPVPGPASGRGARGRASSGAPNDAGDLGTRQPEAVGEPPEAGLGGAAGAGAAGPLVRPQDGADQPGDGGDGRAGAGGPRAADAGARGTGDGRSEPTGRTGAGAAGQPPDGGGLPRPVEPSPANPGPGDFTIDDPLRIVGGGQVARFEKNKAAIELRNHLVDTGLKPTREQQEVLAGYTGWGSFGQELFQGTWQRPAPKKGWEERDRWLRDNLGQKDWEGMQASIINAHYTDPPTVLAMWSMVKRMGFNGGRVLEPSIGIGNFFGMMPADLASRSQRAGIELDPVTGSMAQLLYPEANIQIKGFEESRTPDSFYDLVIGNWPFFEHGPADRRYNRLNPTLHDYFFLKALDQVKPGGLVVGITSKGTMDKKAIGVRMEMARKAELVAAFRLPTGAFEEFAGTKVVTDIVILRKREKPLGEPVGEGWIEVKDHPTAEGTAVPVNEYFHAHPDHVIGRIDYGHGTTTFRPGLIVHRPVDMTEQLARIVDMVPEGAFQAGQPAKQVAYLANHSKDRTNALTYSEQGGLFVVRGDYLAPANNERKYELKSKTATAKREAELRALVDMRRLYGKLIEAERTGDATTERTALREAYLAFVKAHGRLSESFGLNYLHKIDDPFHPTLAALEIRTEKDGKPFYRPAAILTQSTIRGRQKMESPSIADAYVLARAESVNPTIEQVATLAGKPVDEVKGALLESGAGFELPNGDFAASDIYLSGNAREKLREAKAALEAGNTAMQRNVDALAKVLPADVPYYKIETQMGATWVPPSVYADFIAHMLGLHDTSKLEVSFKNGSWAIQFPSEYNHRAEAASGFGSPNVRFKRLVRAAIANQTINVKRKDTDGNEYIDTEATKEANGKIADMRLKFGEWLWSDPVRRAELEREYNEARNSYADPKFDGSFLPFQGMALSIGRGPFNLRKHQIDAIWRAIVMRKSLNAHEVGTGKTFTIGGIAVESRRYGIAKKPMVIAHNANSKSVAHEIQQMYPAAKVLYIDNLSQENVKTRMMQIANDDWDAIVLPHSVIDRIGFKEETLMGMAREEIRDLEIAAEDAAAEDNVTIAPDMWDDEKELAKLRSPTAKQLVKQRMKIMSTIQKLAQQASKDGAVSFEDLGVDMLLVDEAHEFKKPPIATKMKMKGLQTQTSNRSIAMMFLTRYVRAMNNGGNVHLFTGTPITNTMTEVFHMMRYMMQEEMQAAGLADWDGWFGSFAREVNDVELTPTGEYEAVTRLQAFINVPELRRMIGQYMDVVFSDDMPEMRPRSVDGKTMADRDLTEMQRGQLLNGRTEGAEDRPYKKVLNESAGMSPEQLRVFAQVQQYANRWRNMSRKDRKDAMNRGAPESPIIHEGIAAKASFDVRLVEGIQNAGLEGTPEMEPHPTSKPARTLKNLLEIYRGHRQANQVVFMEQGMAKHVTRREGPVGMKRDVTYPAFSTMHDMIERLVQAGVPREEIAHVDGSTSKDRRKEVADAMNEGKIRIVFGSTDSLGVGVNMQRNLRAMHHMDAPWMPGELEQRNGRGHRQGNQWNTVLEYRYLTDRLDGRRWQVLAVKQRFITEFMKSKGDVLRVIEGDAAAEDGGSDILSTFSDAAGDPRVLLREKFKKQLEQLQSRERIHTMAKSDAAREMRNADQLGRTLTQELEDLRASGTIEQIGALLERQRGDGFTAVVDGKPFTKRTEAAEAIRAWANEHMRIGDERVVGTYGGLEVVADWPKTFDSPMLTLKVGKHVATSNGPSLLSLEADLRSYWSTTEAKLEERIARSSERAKHARAVVDEPFHQAEKLKAVQQQLADLIADIARNPVAPPFWLRAGAPADTEVFRDGKAYVVTGHRWSADGWFVLAHDARGEVAIPYLEAKDSQGMPVYEEHNFEPPAVRTAAPTPGGPAPAARHQPGRYQVTDPEGKAEATPRNLSADDIAQLLSHGYTIAAAPESDEPQSFSRTAGTAAPGMTRTAFAEAMAQAFGKTVARRLEAAGVVIPLADQSSLPEHVVPFVRSGDTVFGFYDPRTDRTYAVLANLDASMVKGLVLHEVGVHYGFEGMLGRQKYAKVIERIAQLGREGDNAVAAAREAARRNAAAPRQVPEETLAYLVQNHPEMGLVRSVIASIKAFLFRRFGIGADSLTVDDLTQLAKASVLHASRTQPGQRAPDFAPVLSRDAVPLRPADAADRLAALGYTVETGNEDEGGWIEHQDGTVYDWNDEAGRFEDEDGNPLPKEAAEIAQYIGNVADGFEPEADLAGAANDRNPDPFKVGGRPQRDPRTNSAFRRWFGDSKVVDADGRPLVVYHGTKEKDFTVFQLKNGMAMFSPDRKYAEHMAGKDGRVIEAYLSAKNPMREVGLDFFEDARSYADEVERMKSLGHDAAWSDDGEQIAVFSPEQIKSATGNRGTFDGDDPNIMFSRSLVTGQPLPTTWQAPDATKLDDVIYSMQDKHVDTKRVLQAVRKQVGAIADAQDPYLQEELYHGRAAMATKEFLEKELRPLLADLKGRGVDLSDFEEYLHNRHAQRRNEQVAKVNPAMPDGGSGIKTADAQAYLAALPADKARAFRALAKHVERINRATRALLVSSGLEKQATIAAWEAAYGDEYVPLMREEMDDGRTGLGQGFSVRGSASKRAMGSGKPVADILANIALQREKAITRAEKRRIGEALYGLVLKAPNPDFWMAIDPALEQNPGQLLATAMQLVSMGIDPADAQAIAKEPSQRYIGPDGQVHQRINPALRGADNVLAVRIDGEDKFVFFNARDPRAMRMVTALKNLDADQLGTVMGAVGKMTRYFASINTQYNPIFGVTNITRDVQTALLNLASTPLAGNKADVMKHVLPALRGIYIDLRDHRQGKQPTSAYAQIFEEFQREGGATGYRDMYANAKERAESIADELGAIKAGTAQRVGRGIMGWLSDYNEAMENAVRVATYKVGKEQGLSNQQAASIAKNLTVNFNRKGQVALQAGALYAFFNASVQGTARIAETLFADGKLTGAGQKIIAGGLLLGAMQALLMAGAGFDDDEPPDFVRERSLVFPVGNEKYVSIPMPLGFHILPNLGRIPTEWVLGGFKNTPKRVAQMVGLFADAFNPMGSAGLSLQTLTPTIIDPLAALSENRDWTGKPIARKDFDSLHPTAGHTRAKDVASPWARLISYGANALTGGTDFKPGLVSPTPDQIDYLIGQITGGIGREVSKASQVASGQLSGEEVPLHKIPLVGRFVGTTEGQAAESARFYDNLRELGTHKVELDGLRKSGRADEIGAYVTENPEAVLVPMAERMHREVSKLKAFRRKLVEDNAPQEQVRALDERVTSMMKVFNARVRRLEQPA